MRQQPSINSILQDDPGHNGVFFVGFDGRRLPRDQEEFQFAYDYLPVVLTIPDYTHIFGDDYYASANFLDDFP